MKMLRIGVYWLASWATVCYATVGFDNPVFYRASMTQGTPPYKVSNWTTTVSVKGAQGRATSSRDSKSKKRALLSAYGPMDLVPLGINIENPGAQTTVRWGAADPNNLFTLNPNRPNKVDGTIDIRGRLKVQELDLSIQQTLFSGFFLQADVPLRHLVLDRVDYKRLGSDTLSIPAGANVLTGVDNFLSNQVPFNGTGFLTILQENGFKVPMQQGNLVLPTNFRKTAVPEAVFSAGWQAVNYDVLNYLDGVRGGLQAGIIIPLGTQKNEDELLALPVGFNNHIGFAAKAQGELAVWNFFVVGGYAGVRLFMKADRTIRMKTHKDQQGWLMLGKGKASVDRGSVWDLGGYAKAERIVGGLSIIVGYSFVKQEQTMLHVEDDNFLKTYVANERARNNFVSKDEIVNSDERFRSWDMQTIHACAEYNVKYHTQSPFAPYFSVAYDYPITGRRAFMTDMISGTLAFSARWDF